MQSYKNWLQRIQHNGNEPRDFAPEDIWRAAFKCVKENINDIHDRALCVVVWIDDELGE
jgi:hypothetical protein